MIEKDHRNKSKIDGNTIEQMKSITSSNKQGISLNRKKGILRGRTSQEFMKRLADVVHSQTSTAGLKQTAYLHSEKVGKTGDNSYDSLAEQKISKFDPSQDGHIGFDDESIRSGQIDDDSSSSCLMEDEAELERLILLQKQQQQAQSKVPLLFREQNATQGQAETRAHGISLNFNQGRNPGNSGAVQSMSHSADESEKDCRSISQDFESNHGSNPRNRSPESVNDQNDSDSSSSDYAALIEAR